MRLKIVIMLLFFILTMGVVNASENIDPIESQTDDGNNIITSQNIYEIDESNYNQFFDSGSGKITGNISNGDEIRLGNLSDKKFTIDKTIAITPISSNDCLINSMINLIQGSDKSIVNGIKIINNENTTFTIAMEVTNTNYISIENSYFNSSSPTKINLLLDSTNNTKLSNSTFIKLGPQYMVNIYSTEKCNNISINNCIFEGNETGSILSEDLTKIEKNSSKFEAKFIDIFSNITNTEIIFKINNVEYKRNTDNSGVAKLAINLNPGNYTIQSVNPKTGEIKNNTITVLPRIVENNDLEKFYRNASQYWIKVLDDTGNPAKANEIVTFNINGVFYNRTTNASGYVKLNINLQQGDYIITAEYKGCYVSNNIKVKSILSAEDLTKKYGALDQFKVKLVDGEGNPLANTNVTFNINGVFYNRTTDSNGISKLNIRLMPGEYIITSSYNECYISNKITVTA